MRDGGGRTASDGGGKQVAILWHIREGGSHPFEPRPSPPLTWGEWAGSGGILHAQEFVNFDSAIGIRPYGGGRLMNPPRDWHYSKQDSECASRIS